MFTLVLRQLEGEKTKNKRDFSYRMFTFVLRPLTGEKLQNKSDFFDFNINRFMETTLSLLKKQQLRMTKNCIRVVKSLQIN